MNKESTTFWNVPSHSMVDVRCLFRETFASIFSIKEYTKQEVITKQQADILAYCLLGLFLDPEVGGNMSF
jgi:hypothetical protein